MQPLKYLQRLVQKKSVLYSDNKPILLQLPLKGVTMSIFPPLLCYTLLYIFKFPIINIIFIKEKLFESLGYVYAYPYFSLHNIIAFSTIRHM